MEKKCELYVIKEFEGGNVLVGDSYGTTQYLTKEEYETYLKNRKKLDEKENNEHL